MIVPLPDAVALGSAVTASVTYLARLLIRLDREEHRRRAAFERRLRAEFAALAEPRAPSEPDRPPPGPAKSAANAERGTTNA